MGIFSLNLFQIAFLFLEFLCITVCKTGRKAKCFELSIFFSLAFMSFFDISYSSLSAFPEAEISKTDLLRFLKISWGALRRNFSLIFFSPNSLFATYWLCEKYYRAGVIFLVLSQRALCKWPYFYSALMFCLYLPCRSQRANNWFQAIAVSKLSFLVHISMKFMAQNAIGSILKVQLDLVSIPVQPVLDTKA